MHPLSPSDINDFVERGWTVLRGAFPRHVAEAVVDALSLKCDCDLRNPKTWTKLAIWLREAYTGSPWMDAVTPRLAAAMDQLAGAGRWKPHPDGVVADSPSRLSRPALRRRLACGRRFSASPDFARASSPESFPAHRR